MELENLILKDCYTAAGPEQGWPVVLIHGAVVSKESWLPQLAALSDQFRVIAVDLPGYGALAGIPFSFSTAVEMIAEVVRQESDQPVLAVGMSLGAYTAVEFTAAYPDLVAGLILSGCSPHLKGWMGLYLRLVSFLMARGLGQGNLGKVADRVKQIYPPTLQAAEQTQLDVGVFPEALSGVFREIAGKDYRAPLRRFQGPVFLLNGELDRVSRRGEDEFLRSNPLIMTKTVPQTSHACSLDQAEHYSAAVRGIAEQIFSRRTPAYSRN